MRGIGIVSTPTWNELWLAAATERVAELNLIVKYGTELLTVGKSLPIVAACQVLLVEYVDSFVFRASLSALFGVGLVVDDLINDVGVQLECLITLHRVKLNKPLKSNVVYFFFR